MSNHRKRQAFFSSLQNLFFFICFNILCTALLTLPHSDCVRENKCRYNFLIRSNPFLLSVIHCYDLVLFKTPTLVELKLIQWMISEEKSQRATEINILHSVSRLTSAKHSNISSSHRLRTTAD